MTHPGYFIDSVGGQTIYRCLTCQYDTFELRNADTHCQFNHTNVVLPETDMSLDEWRLSQRGMYIGLKIGISLLTWNTDEASKLAAMALVREQRLLSDLAIDVDLYWADNGSTDETKPLLEAVFGSNLAAKSLFSDNLGQSAARNDLRGHFLGSDCDFWLMVDGDIEITPYSSLAMMRYLLEVPTEIGCIGMYCRNCTHVRDAGVSVDCRRIEPWMVRDTPPIAWTNYGMFRRAVIEQVQFEDSGPFAGPGWGFEDDDFELSMNAAGFLCQQTPYFRHMHRKRHSSLRNLSDEQARSVFYARRNFLVDKWKDTSDYATARTRVIANQTMPTVID